MKEFMYIFIGGDSEETLSPEQMQIRMQGWFAWVDKLKEEDLYIEGRPLTKNAKRVTGIDNTVTDGPFVETKELIGGYFIVKANDMDHAVSLTKDYPDYDIGGTVEIREIMQH